MNELEPRIKKDSTAYSAWKYFMPITNSRAVKKFLSITPYVIEKVFLNSLFQELRILDPLEI